MMQAASATLNSHCSLGGGSPCVTSTAHRGMGGLSNAAYKFMNGGNKRAMESAPTSQTFDDVVIGQSGKFSPTLMPANRQQRNASPVSIAEAMVVVSKRGKSQNKGYDDPNGQPKFNDIVNVSCSSFLNRFKKIVAAGKFAQTEAQQSQNANYLEVSLKRSKPTTVNVFDDLAGTEKNETPQMHIDESQRERLLDRSAPCFGGGNYEQRNARNSYEHHSEQQQQVERPLFTKLDLNQQAEPQQFQRIVDVNEQRKQTKSYQSKSAVMLEPLKSKQTVVVGSMMRQNIFKPYSPLPSPSIGTRIKTTISPLREISPVVSRVSRIPQINLKDATIRRGVINMITSGSGGGSVKTINIAEGIAFNALKIADNSGEFSDRQCLRVGLSPTSPSPSGVADLFQARKIQRNADELKMINPSFGKFAFHSKSHSALSQRTTHIKLLRSIITNKYSQEDDEAQFYADGGGQACLTDRNIEHIASMSIAEKRHLLSFQKASIVNIGQEDRIFLDGRYRQQSSDLVKQLNEGMVEGQYNHERKKRFPGSSVGRFFTEDQQKSNSGITYPGNQEGIGSWEEGSMTEKRMIEDLRKRDDRAVSSNWNIVQGHSRNNSELRQSTTDTSFYLKDNQKKEKKTKAGNLSTDNEDQDLYMYTQSVKNMKKN